MPTLTPEQIAHRQAMVVHLSRQLNHTLQQETRSAVLRLVTDIQKLAGELLLHNQQGRLDLDEMRDKFEEIQVAAYEGEEVIKREKRER